MGWNTFASNGFKPFGEGVNTVITKKITEAIPGVWIVHDLHDFFEKNIHDIWVLGGGQIFKQALTYGTKLYLTRVSGKYDCDVFFPAFEKKFELIEQSSQHRENGTTFHFEVWERKANAK